MRPLWLGVLLAVPLANAQGELFASPHSATCYLDVDGSGGRGGTEPVWLQIQSCGGSVQAGDVRLTNWQGRPGGTIVVRDDDDAGLPTRGLVATYVYYDKDGGGAYNPGDPLFLALGPVPGPLRTGDLPLTGEGAFEGLAAQDTRVGLPVTAVSVAVGGESYAERDGTGGYTTADVVYLDLDGSGRISIGDLRLTGTRAPTSSEASPSATATATNATGETVTQQQGSGAGTSATSSLSTGLSTEARQGAGLPSSVVVVFLALGLLVWRSKH